MKRDTTSTDDDSTSDIDDIVKRLTCTSDGCEVNIFRRNEADHYCADYPNT